MNVQGTTTLFESVALLRKTITTIHFEDLDNPHDYLDDLESVIWVLVYLIRVYDGPGRIVDCMISSLRWEARSESEESGPGGRGYYNKMTTFILFSKVANADKMAYMFPLAGDYWERGRRGAGRVMYKLLIDLFAGLDLVVNDCKLNKWWHETFPESGRRVRELEDVSGRVFDGFVGAFEVAIGCAGGV